MAKVKSITLELLTIIARLSKILTHNNYILNIHQISTLN